MWPYIIRFNTKALLVMTLALGALIVFWYYLLMASKDQLSNASKTFTNIDLKKLLIASIIASKSGGQEVVRIRKNNDLNQRSKGKTKEGVNDVLTEGDLHSHRVMVHSLSAAFPGLRIISEEHSANEDNNIEITPLHISDKLLRDDNYISLPDGVETPLAELTVWVDPLDATKEYAEGLTQYVTTMVCVTRKGEPIIGVIHKPFTSETYWSWTSYGMSPNIKALNTRKISTDNNSMRAIVSLSHAGNISNILKSTQINQNIEVISAAGSGHKTIELIEGRVDAYVHNTIIKKWDICAPNAILNNIMNAKMTTISGDYIKYGYDDNVVNDNGIIATINSKIHENILHIFKNSKQ